MPAEVLAALCTSWFHVHGLPSFILSDRGKEFLGVVTTVCKVLEITHIKTTPYHPKTNGLCESQHKALTYELRIRSDRSSAPEWCDLLTEISFSINITPSESNGAISPFELVFGRKPRLSAVDICFPIADIPVPPKASSERKTLVTRLQQRLQGLRFRALEHSHEHKESLRVAHDRKRSTSNAALHHDDIKPGHIVCAFPVPPSFYLGARIQKQFKGKWYQGIVDDVSQDEENTLWHISYSDFDAEEMDLQQLASHIQSHPLLNPESDLETPEVDTFVWFSEMGRPAFGRVVHIDPTVARPVGVHKYQTSGKATPLPKARFVEMSSAEGEDPVLAHITLHQIRLMIKSLTKGGRMRGPDQQRLSKLLRS